MIWENDEHEKTLKCGGMVKIYLSLHISGHRLSDNTDTYCFFLRVHKGLETISIAFSNVYSRFRMELGPGKI